MGGKATFTCSNVLKYGQWMLLRIERVDLSIAEILLQMQNFINHEIMTQGIPSQSNSHLLPTIRSDGFCARSVCARLTFAKILDRAQFHPRAPKNSGGNWPPAATVRYHFEWFKSATIRDHDWTMKHQLNQLATPVLSSEAFIAQTHKT